MLKVIWNIIKKIFGVLGLILSPLKRLWCRRKRRTSDTILPLTNHYPSVENLSTGYAVNGISEYQQELSPWDTWDEQQQGDKIRSVEEYRQRQQLQQQHSQEPEEEPDYFQDMTPKLKKQTKVLVKKKNDRGDFGGGFTNKLAVSGDIPVLPGSELGSWEDTTNAWDAEADEDLTWEADNVIREKRKEERQQRHLEQQCKKQEREQQKQAKSQNQLTAVKLS